MSLTPKPNADADAARRLAASLDPLFGPSRPGRGAVRPSAGRTPASGLPGAGEASARLQGPSEPSGAAVGPGTRETGPQRPPDGPAARSRPPRPPQPLERPREPLTPFRVLVTGSRSWESPSVVWNALAGLMNLRRPLVVVHGACRSGADRDAAYWCRRAVAAGWNVTEEPNPARWSEHGHAAGPIRNGEMVKLGADLVLAFLRPGSRGTADTVRKAKAAGIPVREFHEAGDR